LLRKFSLGLFLLAFFSSCNKSQDLKLLYPDSDIIIKHQLDWQKTFYFDRIDEFKNDPIGFNKIVFFGNSITYGMRNYDSVFDFNNIVNRGISGDYTEGALNRLDEIIYYKPIAVFLLIGLNDFFDDNTLRTERTPENIGKNIFRIANTIKKGSPDSKIYIQTIMPINNKQYLEDKPYVEFLWPRYRPSINEQVIQLNNFIKQNSNFEIIDLYHSFVNRSGSMKRNLSRDGVHLNENGYKIWIKQLMPYINSLK